MVAPKFGPHRMWHPACFVCRLVGVRFCSRVTFLLCNVWSKIYTVDSFCLYLCLCLNFQQAFKIPRVLLVSKEHFNSIFVTTIIFKVKFLFVDAKETVLKEDM